LTLTSDDLENHIIVNVSSTLTNTTIWFVAALCLIVDVWTDVRTYGRMFLPGLLGHLSGGDLIITYREPWNSYCNQPMNSVLEQTYLSTAFWFKYYLLLLQLFSAVRVCVHTHVCAYVYQC